jgi:hypothetical protein
MRLYDDLAWLWPLWGSIDEYRVMPFAPQGVTGA